MELNMDEKLLFKYAQKFKEKWEGKTIKLENNNLAFIEEARNNAKKFNLLYHCCNMDALLSIIKNKEFWLSNLANVNDKEEYEKIDVQSYKNSYFVGCFTYDNNVPEEHWKEYGSYDNGILFSVKQDWFKKSAVFMTQNNQKMEEFHIFASNDDAMNKKIKEQEINNRIINPYYIFDFDFYQVIYDDDLKKFILSECESKENEKYELLTTNVAGIVKSESGQCCRRGSEPYQKDWTTEKEVRLKVGINNTSNDMNERPIFPKIAVPLSDEAFKEFSIQFSPNVSPVKQHSFIKKLREVLPMSKINVM